MIKPRAMSLYGGMWSGKSSAQIATQIVDDAENWSVNTLYVRPLSSVYGTYWSNPNLALQNNYLPDGTNVNSYGWTAVSNVFRSVP